MILVDYQTVGTGVSTGVYIWGFGSEVGKLEWERQGGKHKEKGTLAKGHRSGRKEKRK